MAASSYPVLVDPSRSDQLVQLADDTDKLNGKLKAQQSGETLGWVAPLIALFQLGTTVGSWFYNSHQQDRQNAYQEGLINKQNAYNSPDAQLNRLLAAGVPYNTAMAAISGTVGAQTQPMSGQAAPYAAASPPFSMGELVQASQMKDAHDIAQSQVRLNDAQSYSLDPDNPLNEAQRVLHVNQALLAGSQAERERELMKLDDAQRRQAEQNIAYLRIQGRKAKWEAVLSMKDAKKRNEWINAQIDSLAAKAGVDRATAARTLFELAVSRKYDAAMSQVNSEGRTGYEEQVYSQFLADLSQRLQNDKDTFFNQPIYAWNRGDMDSLGDWLDAVYYLTYYSGQNHVPGQKVNRMVRYVKNLFTKPGPLNHFNFPFE